MAKCTPVFLQGKKEQRRPEKVSHEGSGET